MTNKRQILPIGMQRSIVFLVFPDFQILDAAGPIAAFEIAARLEQDAYRVRIASLEPNSSRGLCATRSSAGVFVQTETLRRLAHIDTLVVAGGEGTRRAVHDRRLMDMLRRAARSVRRIASVCSGALLLAEAGLLDGRSATTHWSRALEMQKRYPRVRVKADCIYVKDGKFWTSAGISAGIDLALALITEDLGPEIARETARQLVVYARRPGGQTQHSRLLDLSPADGQFAALHAFMRERLDGDLSVPALAKRMRMSPRTFARAYLAETGLTPAKSVERLRLEVARGLIDARGVSLKEVASQTGFGDIERMRRAFVRHYGMPPSNLRRALSA